MQGNYGTLLNQDAKLHRTWFKEMVKLLGVKALYQSPKGNGDYTLRGEFRQNSYTEPVEVGVVFDQNITQSTQRKLGWNQELSDQAQLIHVPYDLENLQVGCLFSIPSAYDNTPNRLFRVTKLSAVMIYPASIACEIVPEYQDTMDHSMVRPTYSHTAILADEEEAGL